METHYLRFSQQKKFDFWLNDGWKTVNLIDSMTEEELRKKI